MKLIELYIKGFGKIENRKFEFSNGINIIYGKNETGKSTLHTFIQSMFFGLTRHRRKDGRLDTLSRYEPWNRSAAYGGYLRLMHDNCIYRIERDFSKNPRDLTIFDETRGGITAENEQELLDEILCGLTETSYRNTISIGQLRSATDEGMAAELKRYISNMNTSGNMTLSITKALDYLIRQRNVYENQLNPEAARKYTSLLGEIKHLEKDLSSPQYANQLSSYQTALGQVRRQLKEKQDERESLLQKISNAKEVLNTHRLDNMDAIHALEKETKDLFEVYQKTKIKGTKRMPFFSISCLVLLSLCSTAVFFLSSLHKGRSAPLNALASIVELIPLTSVYLAVLSGAVVLASAGTAVVLWLRHRDAKRDLKYSSQYLAELFAGHLGDPSISESAVHAFSSRMEEFVRLNDIVLKSEDMLGILSDEINGLSRKQIDYGDNMEKHQLIQWELEKKLEQLTSCKDQAGILRSVLEENERLRGEIAAIDLALETMTSLSATIQDSFGLHLNKTASDLISGITGGLYNSIGVDEYLNLFTNTNEKLTAVEYASSGSIDQVYLALRLATAKLFQTDQDELPLFFDDSFVQYDDERLYTVLTWLSKTYHGQIILFTCHKREAELMRASQIPYHLVTM